MNIDATTEEFLRKNSNWQEKENKWKVAFSHWQNNRPKEDASVSPVEQSVSNPALRVKNPFRSGNITEQMKLYKTDKQLYKKMRAEAFEELEKENPQEAMNFCLNHREIV